MSHYILVAFLEKNCVYEKQKKPIKDQRKFFETYFTLLAKSVNIHSKIQCSWSKTHIFGSSNVVKTVRDNRKLRDHPLI